MPTPQELAAKKKETELAELRESARRDYYNASHSYAHAKIGDVVKKNEALKQVDSASRAMRKHFGDEADVMMSALSLKAIRGERFV